MNNNFNLKQFLAEGTLLKEASSPYNILWEGALGSIIFITKQGKLIQNKILTELDLDPDTRFDIEENIDKFVNHPLYPSYQKEIEETQDLIHDNISYLNKNPEFIQACLQDLNDSDNDNYLYSKIGCIFMGNTIYKDIQTYYDLDQKYYYMGDDDIFISLLEEIKYLNFQETKVVPAVLGGDDLMLDITSGAISSFNNFMGFDQEDSDLLDRRESPFIENIKKYIQQNHPDIIKRKELQKGTKEYWEMWFDILKLVNNDFKEILADESWETIQLTDPGRKHQSVIYNLFNKYSIDSLEELIHDMKYGDFSEVVFDEFKGDSLNVNDVKKAKNLILQYGINKWGGNIELDIESTLRKLGINFSR